ncbi:MAG: CvpA family protein [Alphaproteobacteria bacterium]|nr:CvpA family protein [Alphaproteobacteria bacterium]
MTPVLFDIIVSVIILLSAGIAWYRGLIREVLTIIGLGLAALVTIKGGPMMVPYMNKWMNVTEDGGEKAAEMVTDGMGSDATSAEAMRGAVYESDLIWGILSPGVAAQAAAYGSVFIGTFVVVALISFFLSRSIQELGLTVIDKSAGFIFGVARGFALVFLPYAAAFIMMNGDDNMFKWVRNSVSGEVMKTSYIWAEKRFDISDMVESRGDKLEIKMNKETVDNIRRNMTEAEIELQEALKREELIRDKNSHQ